MQPNQLPELLAVDQRHIEALVSRLRTPNVENAASVIETKDASLRYYTD